MAFKIDAFVDVDEFKRDMDALMDKIVNMGSRPRGMSGSTTPASSSTRKPRNAGRRAFPTIGRL